MISVFEYYSNSGHTLEEDAIIQEGDECYTCRKLVIIGSPTYTFTGPDKIRSICIHKNCSELPISKDFHRHALILKEDVIIEEDAACHICNSPITGSPTYTCVSRDVTITCRSFYLHKSCAELKRQINHHKHNIHPLSLQLRPDNICNICSCDVKICYACAPCDIDVCVSCASEQRVIHHEGHKEHTLTLMKKEALFECDACDEEAKDSSYVCTTCEFWIHKICAFSPSVIPAPTYHLHPLTLIYSIPDIHRQFTRFCGICGKQVSKSCWMYYCHKCTYFVHMKCSTSTISMADETEDDDIDDETDLVRFPLPSQESIFDLIVTQCGKFQAEFKGDVAESITTSTTPNDPHIIKKHWSHKIHPLQRLQFTTTVNDTDGSDDDTKELICNGCTQPISVSQPYYYGCIQCGFYLHSFCATKLPQELPAGASSFHPEHSLLLRRRKSICILESCGVCCLLTNGFYYRCMTCDIIIDIRCAFLPTRIKHKSHKHHSLVQRPSSGSMCSVTRLQVNDGLEYACEICSSFQIHIMCAFLPSQIKHRFDTHPITLKYPPFNCEGVIYCEICEEPIDNYYWLYHCDESGHSFHYYCFTLHVNIKLGVTVDVYTVLDELHTVALIYKQITRKFCTYFCWGCGMLYESSCLFFSCDGCGYLACFKCVKGYLGE